MFLCKKSVTLWGGKPLIIPRCPGIQAHRKAADKLIAYMREHGVQLTFHYVPLHSAPAGLKFGRFDGEDVYTTRESDRLARLPMYYGLKSDDVEQIAAYVRGFYGK